MQRRTEPELMLDAEQVAAYSGADFEAAHAAIAQACYSAHPALPEGALIADLGCGPGDILLRLAAHYSSATVHGFDGSAPMLECARAAIREAAGEQAQTQTVAGKERMAVELAVFPELGELGEAHASQYDLIASNSLLHHLHDARVMWDVVRRLAKPDAKVFIADLRRPRDERQASDFVAKYAAGEPEVLRRDFYNSLLAAFTVDEVRAQLADAGLPLKVEVLSDRHLTVVGCLG